MCLIINSTNGFDKLTNKLIKGIYERNSDGFGYMYHDGEKLQVFKDTLPYRKIRRRIRQLPTDRPVTLHFRLATAGSIDKERAHPFPVIDKDDYKVWMVHNGVLGKYNPPLGDKTGQSDTIRFINQYLRPALLVSPKLWMSPFFKTAIEKELGFSNKVVMFDSEGNTVTFNEHQGVEWEGMWMSNTYAWPSSEYLYDDDDDWWDSEYGWQKGDQYNYGGYGAYNSKYYDYTKNEDVEKTVTPVTRNKPHPAPANTVQRYDWTTRKWVDAETTFEHDPVGSCGTEVGFPNDNYDIDEDGLVIVSEEDFLDAGIMSYDDIYEWLVNNPQRAAEWIHSNQGE